MNDWLKTLAPLLGTALGGPLGGAAASFIADKLGLESKTIEAVSEVLNSGKMTPDQISNIKLAEIEFQKFLKDHEIKVDQLENENVEGARKLKEQTGSKFPELLSALVTIGFFAILVMMTRDKTLVESAPLMIMLGSLGAAFGAVINFWLGSNKGSDRTKELLAQATLK